MGASVTGAIKQ